MELTNDRESAETVPYAPSRAPSDRDARVAASLEPQEIAVDVDLRDRRHALQYAAALIGRSHRIDAAPVFRALWRREIVGSTAIGHGVAIPHARIEGIIRPLTLFLRTKYAIEFAAPDEKPVSTLFVIMVPTAGDADDHLELLALVAELFCDRRTRNALAHATDCDDIRHTFSRLAHRRLVQGSFV